MTTLAGVLAAAGASWAAAPQSTSLGVQASFTSGGVATQLGPVASVVGQPSGRYDYVQKVASASETVINAPLLTRPTASLTVTNLTAHATASGLGVDSRSSASDAAAGDVMVKLSTNPPPGSGLPSVLYLSMDARSALSNANFSQVVGSNSNYANGSVQIGSLNISGALLGGATVKFYGPASANTIVYETPTVKITLNRQILTELITCFEACKITPTKIDVAAVDVELHDAAVGGTKISGHILIGDDTAQ